MPRNCGRSCGTGTAPKRRALNDVNPTKSRGRTTTNWHGWTASVSNDGSYIIPKGFNNLYVIALALVIRPPSKPTRSVNES